jgi:hypothetical protein
MVARRSTTPKGRSVCGPLARAVLSLFPLLDCLPFVDPSRIGMLDCSRGGMARR